MRLSASVGTGPVVTCRIVFMPGRIAIAGRDNHSCRWSSNPSTSTQKEHSRGALGHGLLKAHGGWKNGIDKTKERSKEKHQESSFCGKTKTHIAHLPKSVRTALGKQASSVANKKRKSRKRG
jgi:hypothetical protein